MTGQLSFDLWLERPRRAAVPEVPTLGLRSDGRHRPRPYVRDCRGVLRRVRCVTVRLAGVL